MEYIEREEEKNISKFLVHLTYTHTHSYEAWLWIFENEPMMFCWFYFFKQEGMCGWEENAISVVCALCI